MMAQPWRNYLLVLAGSAGLAALLFFITAAGYVHNVRWDLSPGSRFTLSDHTLAVVRGVEQPIRITGFIRTEDARNPLLKDLLWQVARENPHLSYTIVDVNRNPTMAAEFGVTAYGSTVVESDTRRSHFSNPSEGQLSSALLYVTQPPKKIYALSGHGECSPSDRDRHSGCSMMRDAMFVEFYEVEELALYSDGRVPDDAAVVLIAGPRKDPVEGELEALSEYLAGGGKLVVMLEPYTVPRLVAWLRQYGIEAGENAVVDPENRLAGGEALSALVPELNSRQLITARLDAPPLFSGTRTIDARADSESGREAVWLLKTGPASWASHDASILRGERARFVAGRDLNGPLTVAQEVFAPATAADAPAGTRMRILAFGDVDFVSNRFIDYFGNRDLLLNSINWLAREERLIAPRAKAKEAGTKYFFPTQQELRSIFVGAVVAQPGIFMAIGIVVFTWRRLRP